jgi:hypothetical protein
LRANGISIPAARNRETRTAPKTPATGDAPSRGAYKTERVTSYLPDHLPSVRIPPATARPCPTTRGGKSLSARRPTREVDDAAGSRGCLRNLAAPALEAADERLCAHAAIAARADYKHTAIMRGDITGTRGERI